MRKRMIKILFMVVIIVGLIPFGAVTTFAEDNSDYNSTVTYLYLDGIEGESKDPAHNKWIDAIYCYQSSEHPESGILSETYTLKHLVDNATPKLQEYCMKGTTIDTGVVHYCRQVGGQQEVVYAIKLEDITVTKAQIEIEDLPDGAFQLVEIVEMQVDRTTRTENVALPEEPDNTMINPGDEMGSTEIERIRTLLDEYDRLAQDPSYKAQMDAVPGYTEWIAQLRIRLAELEGEERENKSKNENVNSTDSNLSPATGITGTDDALPIALACIGLAVIGLSVVWFRSRKQ